MELCEALGISINEFLAGEDISGDNIAKSSENNLLQILKDGAARQRILKRVIFVLAVLLILAAQVLGIYIYRAVRPQNFIYPMDSSSTEMQTAKLLSGPDGAFLYKYKATDEFKTITLLVAEYHDGKLIKEETAAALDYDKSIGSPKEGVIVIIPDFESFEVKLIFAEKGATLSAAYPILANVKDRDTYGRASSQIDQKRDIKYDSEQGVLALIYDNDEMSVPGIKSFENGEIPKEDDYIYYFKLKFGK